MQTEIKAPIFEKPLKIFLIEAFLFSLTQVLGVLAAAKLFKYVGYQGIVIAPFSLWNFLLTFFFSTLFLLLLIRFLRFKKQGAVLFKSLFVIAIFSGGVLFLNVWLALMPAAILMATLIFWWLKNPSVLNQNICMILGMAGIGSGLGLKLTPNTVVLVLIILSIYDWIAVYKTKHMIKIAKEMMGMGAISALVIPQKISDFNTPLLNIRPGTDFLILGGGDIVFPLIFAASLIPFGTLKSSIVTIFSLIGLFFDFYFFVRQKVRKPMPALPLIALFSIIGYLITLRF